MYSTIVDASTLAQQLEDPKWRVFDCRHDLMDVSAGEKMYAAGHIPGAWFARVEEDLAGPRSAQTGRHPLPDPETLMRFLRHRGVDDDTQIVAYDASGGAFASRLWWLLRWLGHDAVAVLDGGWAQWKAQSHPVSQALPRRQEGHLERRPSHTGTVTSADVEANLSRASFLVVDARTPERYRGEVEPIDPVAGHIPGAQCRPWQANLTPEGLFKPADTLREEYNALFSHSPHGPGGVVHACGSGVTACHNVLAMHIAGFSDTPRLYAGSFSEWITDPRRPVATGPEPERR